MMYNSMYKAIAMRTTDIKTFSEHRKHLREDFDQVRETGRPLVITSNGVADAVVLSPKEYDTLVADAEEVRHHRLLRQSIAEAEHGEGTPAEEVFKEMRRILGLSKK